MKPTSATVMLFMLAAVFVSAQPAIQIGHFASEEMPENTEPPVRTAVFPHLISGKGWTSSYYITNADREQPAPFQLRLLDMEGRASFVPLQLNSGAVTFGSLLSGTLRPAESIVVDVVFPAGSVAVYGWAELSSTAAPSGFTGYAVYSNQESGKAEQSYLVPLDTKAHKGMALMMDNRAGRTTGVAIVNPDPYSAADLDVRVVNRDGTPASKRVLRIGPRRQITFAIADLFPEVKDCLAKVEFEGRNGWTQVSGFGVRVGPDGQVKYLPAIPQD